MRNVGVPVGDRYKWEYFNTLEVQLHEKQGRAGKVNK